MFLNLDNFVIETYAELAAAVLVATALIAVLARLYAALRRYMAQKRADARGAAQLNPFVSPVVTPQLGKDLSRRRIAEKREFDRLAGMIADVSARADQLTETQNKAALKLDSAEMAVRRVLDDIGHVMPVAALSASTLPMANVTQAPAPAATRSAA